MQVNIHNTILSDLAINQLDGIKLFDTIKGIEPSSLLISFDNIKFVSTAFLNESIGKYAQLYSVDIHKLSFEYGQANEHLAFKITDVIENALMGEEYSALVDTALASL